MEITMTTLNEGSRNLLSQLPDGVGSLVEGMARDRSIPLWHYVAGILLEVHTEGRLAAVTIDPSWKVGFKKKLSICEQCHRRFVPKHVNQPYCSDRCGQIIEYEKKLKAAPKPVKPVNDKKVQDMENYIADVRYRQELQEIINLLKSGVPIEQPEPVRRNSGGTDLGGSKRIDVVSKSGSSKPRSISPLSTPKSEPKTPDADKQPKTKDSKPGNRTARAGE